MPNKLRFDLRHSKLKWVLDTHSWLCFDNVSDIVMSKFINFFWKKPKNGL